MQNIHVEGFRLSPHQRQLWLLDQEAGFSRARCTVMITGMLHAAALKGALERAAGRHEILRTVFPRAAGIRVPVQVIRDQVEIAWRQLDWSDRGPEAQAAALAELSREEDGSCFDLEAGPVVRASLVTLSPARHRLLLSLPSLCADARTLRNLVWGIVQDLAGAAPAEVVQYLQFSEWQNEMLEGEADLDAADYWRRQDVSGLDALTLPFERGSGGDGAGDRGSHSRRLGGRLAAQVAKAAAEAGISEASFLFAALQALLFRLTGQARIVCGALADGRKYEELEGTLGLMTRFLPVGAELDEDLPFRSLAKRTHRAAAEAAEWQEFFWPERDGDAAKPWSCVFEWEEEPEAWCAGNLIFKVVEQSVRVDHARLRLSCIRSRDDLVARLDFDTFLIRAADVERLADQYRALLTSAARDLEAPLGDLDIVGVLDRRRVLEFAAGLRAPLPAACIHHLFERQVERTPEAVAAEAGGERLSYRELDARANRLARYLRRLGVGPGVPVALYLDRSLEALLALLAVLKAGGAYLPIDLAHPEERVRFLLEDSGAAAVITRERLLERLPTGHPTAICLEGGEWGSEEDETDLRDAAGPDDLAYILYTSGSTGRPKGVMVPHRGVINYLSWCIEAYEVGRGEGSPVHSSLGFDLTVTSLLAPLAAGRRVVLLPEEQGLDSLASVLGSGEAFSLLKITPAHLEVLGQLLAEKGAPVRPGTVVVGGEALRGESLRSWRVLVPGCRVINEYGPTETVVGCCVYEVPSDGTTSGAAPIGRPIANTEIYLVSPRLRPVPAEVAGEILVGGAGLARGYLGRPDLTAEKFVPSPFAETPGERLYRTGDLGRWRPDGELEFLGRIDHQVKIRGFRVELGEIEAVLGQHPGVREAVALAQTDGARGPRLLAYFVPAGEPGPTAEELSSFLQARLPDYMVPALFLPMPTLPLTTNGKVDRRALPLPDPERSRSRAEYVPPRDAIELKLTQIWEELLAVQPIGIHDSFFALGGHSLLAVRMMVRIRKELGRDLPVASLLFQVATIEELAALLREQPRSIPWSPLVEIQKGGSRPPLFLVHPHGGSVLCYLALARHLGADQPVYGLQARGRDEDEEPMTRVEEMAACYLEAVRSVQPAGPYALGGWSFGGVVAYEMAQQLRAAGEEVEVLAVLDGDFLQDMPMSDAEFLVDYFGREFSLSLEDVLQLESFDDLLRCALERARSTGLLPEFEFEDVRRYFRFYKATHDAAQRYAPRPYMAPVRLFLSRQLIDHNPGDPSRGLRDLAAGGLEIFVLQGLHRDLVQEPRVQIVAGWLRDLLSRRGSVSVARRVLCEEPVC